MRLEDYDYALPPELIAQEPAATRDASRLLVVRRRAGKIEHGTFADLPCLLQSGDVLVLNDTRVMKCRLLGETETGRPVELLLVRSAGEGLWEALAKPGKRGPGRREDNGGRRARSGRCG